MPLTWCGLTRAWDTELELELQKTLPMDLLHSRRKALTGGEGLFLILPRRGCSLVDRVARQGVHFQGRLSRRRTWFVRTGLHHVLASPTPRILEPHCVWEPRDLFIFPCLQQTAQKRIETAVRCSMFGVRVEQALCLVELCGRRSPGFSSIPSSSTPSPGNRHVGAPAEACSFPRGQFPLLRNQGPTSGIRDQTERYGKLQAPSRSSLLLPEHQQQCDSR